MAVSDISIALDGSGTLKVAQADLKLTKVCLLRVTKCTTAPSGISLEALSCSQTLMLSLKPFIHPLEVLYFPSSLTNQLSLHAPCSCLPQQIVSTFTFPLQLLPLPSCWLLSPFRPACRHWHIPIPKSLKRSSQH